MSGPANGWAPAWPAGEHSSFEAALAAGGEVRSAAIGAGPSLPRKDLSRLYPSTMQDAVAVVHARLEENKKKAAASKQKSKSKSGAEQPTSDSHFPGARPGAGDPSAFWLYIEDYFRDFTQDDLRMLLPLIRDPRDDAAFRVPPCGRRVEDEQQARKQAAAKAAVEAAKAAAAAVAASEWEGGRGGSAAGGHDGSPDAERRSSRLVSRHSREEEQRRQLELEAQALAAASAAEQAEAAAAVAAARAMAEVPTTASGAAAKQLLDVLPEQRLALLLDQLHVLQQATGRAALDASDDPAAAAALARLAGAASSNGSTSELDSEARQHLTAWLRGKLAELAGQLGCAHSALPPWAGRTPPGREAAAAAAEGDDAAAGSKKAATAAAAQQQQQQGTLAVRADHPAAQVPFAAYTHPYTELMLAQRVPPHVVAMGTELPAPEALPGLPRQATMAPGEMNAAAAAAGGACEGGDAAAAGEVATPGASLMAAAATPGPLGLLSEVPSVANLSSLCEAPQAGAADDDAAAPGPADTADAAALASPAGGAPLDGAAAPDADGTPADGGAVGEGGGAPGSGAAAGRTGGRARAVSDYALLAGKKSSTRTAPPKKAVRATARQEAELAAQHPVAHAVAAMVAAAEPERSAGEQWAITVAPLINPPLMAAAPEDEVLAELLALQNELMAQAAANRARLLPALQGVLGELETRAATAERRAAEEEEVKAWIMKMREIKRQQHRQIREQAHAEAMAAKKQTIMASPRPVLGRARGSHATLDTAAAAASGDEREGSPQLEFALRPDELYDVLAQRDPDQEAFCAVCGDGTSEPPNQIVFCERCDVAVHQNCYGIAVVPEGEWLCEPCKQYEEVMKAQGMPQGELRPVAWQQANPDTRRPLEGGGRSVKCALCPIKYGAFKRAEDGHRWVHSACALWLPEPYLSFRELPSGARQEFVGGVDKVKGVGTRCAICGLADGAVMSCQQPGGCATAFHVLCARNIGLYLTIRPDPSRKTGQVQYRGYCALHSAAQQARDEKVWQERMERAAAVQQKESKVKQAKQAERDRALLAQHEAERKSMAVLRVNIEQCRLIADIIQRRERKKKQLLVLQQQQWPALQADPVHGLEILEKGRRLQAERAEQHAAAAASVAGLGPGLAPAASTAAAQLGAEAAPVLPAFNFQLPPAGLPPLIIPPPPGGAAQQAQQQQQQQQLAGLPALQAGEVSAASLFAQQQQMLAAMPLPQAMPAAPPAFALDMFEQQAQQQHSQQQQAQQQQAQQQQQQQQQARQQQAQQQAAAQAAAAQQQAQQQQLTMQAQQQQLAMHAQQQQFFLMQQQQQQQARQRAQGGVPHLGPFPGIPLGMQPQQLLMHPQQPELPATAAGMLVNAGGNAAAAQVPADVAAAMFSAPSAAMLPQMPLPMGLPGGPAQQQQQQQRQQQQQQRLMVPLQQQGQAFLPVDPAVAAMWQPQPQVPLPAMPLPQHLTVQTGNNTAGTPRGGTPQPESAGGSGRPKRAAAAAAAQPSSHKRRRGGSEEAAPALAAAAAAAAAAGGADSSLAAGRRQRTASAKVRENLLQRERQMTAEEAEALNARLPGSLRYLPVPEVEATLGSPTVIRGRGSAGASGGSGSQRQGKPRGASR
ncbi:peregrin isoform X2 [Micractinium conductrix]|uniref:Peregrin isoform X2 n=1 Tax=Micractinium conductrix TaxID=554055 RepID=A0A2P6VAH8_9CHLO|nr:peregrin isoform X2 [Micractinium conductrix]|eukprot:PSC71102.1 peregrin isoform X2 [Micractinium conductrix]